MPNNNNHNKKSNNNSSNNKNHNLNNKCKTCFSDKCSLVHAHCRLDTWPQNAISAHSGLHTDGEVELHQNIIV